MSIRFWSKRAKRGEALLYHTGLLMKDRQASPVLDAVANLLWSLHESGALALVQHKTGAFTYEYLAVKR